MNQQDERDYAEEAYNERLLRDPDEISISPTAQCLCRAPATNQAIYRKEDGSHFLGSPACDAHRYLLGPVQYNPGTEIVDYMEIST